MLSLLIILLLTFPLPSSARPLIADISIRSIDIDTNFKGTDILLFGARNDPGDIVVVLRGPKKSYIVRKKERVLGVWANKEQVVFDNAEDFYSLSSSRPLDNVQNDYLLGSLGIGIDKLNLIPTAKPDVNISEFREAFTQQKKENKLYSPEISDVSFIGDTLFRTVISFPENIARGIYTAEIYLFSDGQLSGLQSTPIIVSKKGFDATVYDFAYAHPGVYGIIAITIALLAGWVAGIVFRRV